LIGINYVAVDFDAIMKFTRSIDLPFFKEGTVNDRCKHRHPICRTAAEQAGGQLRSNVAASAMGAHGHEMHPQEFIRLIGCSDQKKQEGQLSKECAP
jgi:hypothetical protein